MQHMVLSLSKRIRFKLSTVSSIVCRLNPTHMVIFFSFAFLFNIVHISLNT